MNALNVVEFSPRWCQLFYPGEPIDNLHYRLKRIWYWLRGAGGIKIFFVRDDQGAIIHYSWVLYKNAKHPFLGRKDFVIGPCWASPSCRGRGIYPAMIAYIMRRHAGWRFVYMNVQESNLRSIHGIEKAGLTLVGELRRAPIWHYFEVVPHKEGETK